MRVVLTFLAPGQTRMKVDESCFDFPAPGQTRMKVGESCFDFPCSWLNKDES